MSPSLKPFGDCGLEGVFLEPGVLKYGRIRRLRGCQPRQHVSDRQDAFHRVVLLESAALIGW